jgi:hypothetical protein
MKNGALIYPATMYSLWTGKVVLRNDFWYSIVELNWAWRKVGGSQFKIKIVNIKIIFLSASYFQRSSLFTNSKCKSNTLQ